MGASSIEPERITASYAVAVWQRMFLWVVDGHTPEAELEHLRHRVEDWSRATEGTKHVALVVLYPSRSSMSTEERRVVLKMIEQTKHLRAASATVVLARGMMGALHRSILTGFSLLLPPPHPAKVFAETAEAIDFLRPHIEALCGPLERGDLSATVERLHRAIVAHRGGSTPPSAL